MPGTNLTRDEANQRAALVAVDHYLVQLDLTTGADTFSSTTTGMAINRSKEIWLSGQRCFRWED